MTQDKAPRDFQGIKEFTKKGLIIVNTGDGKGKSTSAFGTALRALGRGYRVGIVQFIKGSWTTGEGKAFERFSDLLDIFIMGEGFTWDTKDLQKDKQCAQKAWDKCKELLRDETYQLVIFDEINYVLSYEFLDTQEILRELNKKPAFTHVILTGRNAPRSLIEIADLVTDMKCVKHPYSQGIKAQPGIEY
jgi:cob(I)alamin adenosyltransferase